MGKATCSALAPMLHHAVIFDLHKFGIPNLHGRSSIYSPRASSVVSAAKHCSNTDKKKVSALLLHSSLSSSNSITTFTSNSSCIYSLPRSITAPQCAGVSEGGRDRRNLLVRSSLTNWETRKFLRHHWRDLQTRHVRTPSLPMASPGGGPPENYRPNVGICVVNAKDEVFVASRLDLPESWQMPQGGVDDGEEPQNAAIRELREEAGLSSVELIGQVPEWLTYDFPPDVKIKITRLWGREWTGQAQKWFLFRFHGDDGEINLDGDGSEKPEFGEWKWLPAREVLKRAVDFKKPVYAQAFKALAVYIDSWSKL